MNHRPAIGRADLVRALANKPKHARARIAAACGCFPEDSKCPPSLPVYPTAQYDERQTRLATAEPPTTEAGPPNQRGQRYLVPMLVKTHGPEERPFSAGTGRKLFDNPYTFHEIEARTSTVPESPPLQPWSRLWPWLRHALGRRIEGRRIDSRQLIRMTAQAEPIRRLPRLRRLSWADRACVVVDRQNALAPFWDDFDSTLEKLERIRGKEGLTVQMLQDAKPEPGVPVLVLGDLGRCSQDAAYREFWLRSGRQWLRQGNTLSALLPCPRDRWDAELSELWRCGCWDRGQRLPRQGLRAAPTPGDFFVAKRNARVEAVLTLLSPALRVESGLLRFLTLLCEGGVDVEFDVWNSPEAARTPLAMALHPELALRRRAAFSSLDEPTKKEVGRLLEVFHAGCSPTIQAREILNLAAGGGADTYWRVQKARELLRRANATLFHIAQKGDIEAAERTGLFEWQAREVARVAENERSGDQEISIGWALRRHWNRDRKTMDRVPKGINPAKVAWVQNLLEPDTGVETVWELLQQGRALMLRRRAERKSGLDAEFAAGPPLSWLLARRPRLDLTLEDEAGNTSRFQILKPTRGGLTVCDEIPNCLRLETDCGEMRAFTAQRPEWAERMAYDGFGLYADLKVNGVPLRLRWIPPGRFRMGSPKEENRRGDNEGPAHEVTISKGYWLAETPCTQAQWEAVMGENPSHFKGASRPVESINWRQCLEFCERLRKQEPSLNFRLPTEAEWEYACRAGTNTAFNDGSDCTLPEGKDIALDRLGWFNDNSGVETHPVREKQGNAWGLYDMHGNVWEWCLDSRRDYSETPQTDPFEPTDASAWRALRGGSCWDDAWYCRAAYRLEFDPGDRIRHVGFRLASGQPRGSGATKSRGDGGASAGAEGRGSVGEFFGIGLDFGKSSGFAILKPRWAQQFGQDRFGHYSTFEVRDIAFRLRWIEAGSFLMGSPRGEQGRDDDEGPKHKVTISRGFWLGETPCTQEQWEAVMGNNPGQYKGRKNPVDSVTWDECIAFCERLNERSPELELRLPTEAEWEYACRAETNTAFNDGSACTVPQGKDPALERLGWYAGNSGRKTHPVGEKEVNAWGLYDMHGNVLEWCLDGLRNYKETSETDALGSTKKSAGRALRGGSCWAAPGAAVPPAGAWAIPATGSATWASASPQGSRRGAERSRADATEERRPELRDEAPDEIFLVRRLSTKDFRRTLEIQAFAMLHDVRLPS